MRRVLMTIGFGLALFGTTVVASAQEKQAPEQKAVQAPVQKAAPVQKHMEPTQSPTQKHVQGNVQKPTQKPTQKGDCCERPRRFGRRCC